MEHQILIFSGLFLGAVYALIGMQLIHWLSRHLYWKSDPSYSDANWVDQSPIHPRLSHVSDLRGTKHIIQ